MRQPGFAETVVLTATLISMVALSIDAMLPALPEIARDLKAPGPNDGPMVVSALLLGLAVGQLFWGPLSDSYGRKAAIASGLLLYMAGALIAALSADFTSMVAARIVQGFGAAGPRVVTVAMIRDQYSGRQMARVMSFIMSVFILVPALAPSVGQVILIVAGWRAIFGVFVALAAIGLVWLSLRQPETLAVERRRKFAVAPILAAMRECLRHPTSRGYILTAGFIFGGFIGFLTSVQPIFAEVLGQGDAFPIYFGVLGLVLGMATMTNATLVMRLGMRRLAWRGVVGFALLAAIALAVATISGGKPSLIVLMVLLAPQFFCFGLLFGNFNALAMEPMGHIAGSASAIIGAATSLMAVAIGTTIGQLFDGTVLPLFGGWVVVALAALVTMAVTEGWARLGARAGRPAADNRPMGDD